MMRTDTRRPRARSVWGWSPRALAGALSLAGLLGLASCSVGSSKTEGGADASAQLLDGGVRDGGARDSGVDLTMARCAPSTDSTPSNSGGDCVFNGDCPAAERCECANGVCACKPGARGLGCAGWDPCTDGNDCTSSVCAEGQGTTFVCSGPCVNDQDCGPLLPRCLDIAFIGRICVRALDGGS